MDEGKSSESHNHGSGQSVAIVIGSGEVKWLLVALVVLIGLLMWTTRAASNAEIKASQAVRDSERAQTESRMAQFWIERTKALLDARGIETPKLPASYGKSE